MGKNLIRPQRLFNNANYTGFILSLIIIEFNDKILKSAKEIVDLADNNPEIFLLLPLLEEGIAGDRISDMVQNIIDEDICKYTQKIMEALTS